MRLNPFKPPRPAAMSDEEARLAAILPPIGHTVPAAPATDRLQAPLRALRFSAHFAARRRRIAELPLGSPEFREEMQALLAIFGISLKVWPGAYAGGAAIYMWNQASHLDHLVLGAAISVAFRMLFNIELAKVPLYGDWLRQHEHYLVDRFDEAQWRASVAAAAAYAREGNAIVLSPEGTRSWDGRILPMKRGAFILAIASGCPIIPVVIHGAHEALPRGRFVVKAGTVEVEFRAPIPTAGYTDETRKDLKAVVAQAFTQALSEGPPSRRPERPPS